MLQRFPKLQEILPVYAVIATIVFGWSLVTFFWKLPSWLFFLNIGEILTILAYTFSTDLLESLAWLGILLFLAFVLPDVLLRNKFAERGSSLSLVTLGSLAIFVNRYEEVGSQLANYLILWMGVTLLLAIFLAYLGSRVRVIGSGILWFTDRLIVFLFLLIPIGVLSLIVILIRNIS